LTMQIRQAFRFRLREQPVQARVYARTAGCCRFVWNKALALQHRYYRLFGKHLSYNKLANRLPRWKRRHTFLTEAPSQTLQQTLKDLDTAWSRFFKEPQRVGRPRFKGRDARAAFRLPQSIEFDSANARVRLAKLGWVRLRLSRDVLGQIKNATVSREQGQWFVSLQTEREVEIDCRVGSAVGVDVGAARSATATGGQILVLELRLAKHAARLRYLQRCLSRKQKGSRRRQRAKHRLAAVHARLARTRNDAVHKLSRSLVDSHAVVCLEDLQVAVMTAAGSGRKARLNARILAAGWGALRQQVAFKTVWSGGAAVAVNPAYTSQRCNACGHTERANRTSQAVFRCVACGHTAHADENAALNIRERGVMELLRAGTLARAPGDAGAEGRYIVLRPSSHVESADVRCSKKREPTEALRKAA
jgi:putative transposase